MLHTDTFDQLANAVIFKLNFVSLSSKFKGYIVLLINFKAQKARENLRREKGAEEISLKSFKKQKGAEKIP